jgi:hypothetical protein
MAWNIECHEPVAQSEILNTFGLKSETSCQERLVRHQVLITSKNGGYWNNLMTIIAEK